MTGGDEPAKSKIRRHYVAASSCSLLGERKVGIRVLTSAACCCLRPHHTRSYSRACEHQRVGSQGYGTGLILPNTGKDTTPDNEPQLYT